MFVKILNYAGFSAGVGLAVLPVILMASPVFTSSSASAESTTSEITVTINDIISLSATSAEVDITPDSSTDTFITAKSNIISQTNAETGYTIQMSSSSPDLTGNLATISNLSSATTGTNMDANTWGYTTSAVSEGANDASDLALTYSPIPTSAATLVQTDGYETGYDGEEDFDVGYGVKISPTLYSGSYATTITYTATAEKVVMTDTPTFNGITTMQEMTSAICAAETTPDAYTDKGTIVSKTTTTHTTSTAYVPQSTLRDIRDGNYYTVRKLADGNCWMVQNLKLANYTMTSSDSDVTTNAVMPALTASSNADLSYTESIVTMGLNGNYLYNWHGAVGYASGTTTIATIDATTSACPKNWQLPGRAGSKTIYNLLATTYAATADNLYDTPLDFENTGAVDYNNHTLPENRANYWTNNTLESTHANPNKASIAYGNDVYMAQDFEANGYYKGNFFAIRCVAK